MGRRSLFGRQWLAASGVGNGSGFDLVTTRESRRPSEGTMKQKVRVVGKFNTRRDAELAVELSSRNMALCATTSTFKPPARTLKAGILTSRSTQHGRSG